MSKETDNNWKNKALSRSKAIKSLNKEIVRQTKRASTWREEALSSRKELINKDLIINNLSTQKAPILAPVSSAKVRGYSYDSRLVWLCVTLYKSGLSLRQVQAVIAIIAYYIGKKIKTPSHSIISIWVHKVGLSELKDGVTKFEQSKEQWSLIIDESFSLGKSRLLVILGIRLSSLQTGRIGCEDVVPLVIKSQAYWKSEDISSCLSTVCRKFKGKIAYVTSDNGSNLLSTYKKQGLLHVPDWSHYGANLLEHSYAEVADFKEFNEKMGAFKRKRKQSIYTHYVPPNLSVKVRFMNYIPFLEWATIMLANYKRIPSVIEPELAFLKALQPFIEEVCALFYAVQDIGKIIKAGGINPTAYGLVVQKLTKLAQQYPNNTRVTIFIQNVEVYFKQTLDIYYEYSKNQDKNTPFLDGVIATSEILECIFGKVKHRSDKNPKRGFSANSLLISLFCNEVEEKKVINALRNIDSKKLEKWKNKNICNRKYTSFRNVFKKKRGRKKRRN